MDRAGPWSASPEGQVTFVLAFPAELWDTWKVAHLKVSGLRRAGHPPGLAGCVWGACETPCRLPPSSQEETPRVQVAARTATGSLKEVWEVTRPVNSGPSFGSEATTASRSLKPLVPSVGPVGCVGRSPPLGPRLAKGFFPGCSETPALRARCS